MIVKAVLDLVPRINTIVYLSYKGPRQVELWLLSLAFPQMNLHNNEYITGYTAYCTTIRLVYIGTVYSTVVKQNDSVDG
jgi:hypothetical protein